MYSQTRPDQCFVPAANISKFPGCGLVFLTWLSDLFGTALTIVCTHLQYIRIQQWKAVLARTSTTVLEEPTG